MAIYKKVDGEDIKLKPKEIKTEIMRVNKWTAEEYQKHYDIFKNKLRNFEAFERAHGKDVKVQSPVEILYKQAMSKLRQKDAYKPSLQMQKIMSFTSQSISKSKKMEQAYKQNVRTKAMLNQADKYENYSLRQFAGLIASNETARKLASIKDPVIRDKALSEFANQMHVKFDEEEKALEETGSTFATSKDNSMVVGSHGFDNFDTSEYDAYLEDEE